MSAVNSLPDASVAVIRAGQGETGAYLACPTFAPYRYCWFRDGSFIADAMSRAGEVESAERFFDWCAGVIEARAVEIRAGHILHARYTAEGNESATDWPIFQVDGYGLWLWALRQHVDRHGASAARWQRAVELTIEYLHRHGGEPCVDVWEERMGLHAATLACVAAGLESWGEPAELPEPEHRLDASLLFLPFLDRGRPPLAEIEARLVSPGGGVHRHLEDTYYGGGEWLLLTAMLGLCQAALGRVDEAREARVDRRARDRGGRASGAVAGPPARAGVLRAVGAEVGPAAVAAALVARHVPHPRDGARITWLTRCSLQTVSTATRTPSCSPACGSSPATFSTSRASRPTASWRSRSPRLPSAPARPT